jgi:glycosyltransferase involved in cell wall biosynthesis
MRHAEAVASRHRVHVLHLVEDPTLTEPIEIQKSSSGNLKTTIVYFRKTRLPHLGRLRALRAALAHLKSEAPKPDLIHHHVIFPAGWQTLSIIKQLRVPLVVTEHWTLYNRIEPGGLSLSHRMLIRLLSRRSAALCPVTLQLGKSIQSHGWQGDITVVPNVVDTSLFRIGSKPTEIVRFLHVSSLNEDQKNISGILRTWKRISGKNTSAHLSIGGDGPWTMYRDLAEEMEIPAHSITFFGEQAWSGIAELMSHAHVLLLFSNYENLPCVIVEALASGMRILSTDVGGISEHVTPSRGTLITARDEDALEAAIIAEVQLAPFTDRQQLRQYAESHFSIPSICEAFSSVYGRALESHSKEYPR